ncbi:MAG TPA: S53 family peptidase, partial [Acidimicrobiales bacterium]|nr:S53 family peptidase [Acidimicrobiales bacterium]
MRRSSVRLRTGIALSALTLALSPVLALQAGASSGGWTPVAQGVNPAKLPGAVAFGSTSPSTPEQVSFILDEQNKSSLEQGVENGSISNLSVSAFASQYGQTQANITALTTYLAKFGIVSTVYKDNVDVATTGTAGEYDAALSTSQDQYKVPAYPGRNGGFGEPAQTVHGATTAPELPSQLASFVLAILGLSNYSSSTSQAVHALSGYSTPQSGSSNACLALVGLPDACNTPANFEQNYGLSSLESRNAGAGQTIGIVTLAALDVGAPEYFWEHILGQAPTGRSVTVDNVDNGPGAPSWSAGSTETDLDVEQSGGIAPGANIVVYQAPNTDPGFADAFFTAASQNVAGSVSSSWGESETVIAAATAEGEETSAYIAAFDEAFLELAAQGQATFVSAGDSGAYDAQDDAGTTNLAVDSPGDSPYVTSSGGTTLPWSGTFSGTNSRGKTITAPVQVTAQRTWGWDYLWQPIATVTQESLTSTAESLVVGGGGGYSQDEPTPSYQQGVSGVSQYNDVQYLTPTDYNDSLGIVEPFSWSFNPTPSVQHGSGSGRAEPDLATDADPETGYLEYSPSFVGSGNNDFLQGGWGGTSFVAPELNGSTAVIDATLGHRVGFWNPQIYKFATSSGSP